MRQLVPAFLTLTMAVGCMSGPSKYVDPANFGYKGDTPTPIDTPVTIEFTPARAWTMRYTKSWSGEVIISMQYAGRQVSGYAYDFAAKSSDAGSVKAKATIATDGQFLGLGDFRVDYIKEEGLDEAALKVLESELQLELEQLSDEQPRRFWLDTPWLSGTTVDVSDYMKDQAQGYLEEIQEEEPGYSATLFGKGEVIAVGLVDYLDRKGLLFKHAGQFGVTGEKWDVKVIESGFTIVDMATGYELKYAEQQSVYYGGKVERYDFSREMTELVDLNTAKSSKGLMASIQSLIIFGSRN